MNAFMITDSNASYGLAPSSLGKKTQYVKELKDKDPVASPFLIKTSTIATDRNQKSYMNLVLMDKSGEIEARIWDAVAQHSGQAVKDQFVWIEGKIQLYQGRRQLVIKHLQILREDEVEIKDYLVESRLNPDDLMNQLNHFITTMKDPYYRALVEAVVRDDVEIVSKLRIAPAAKSVHHAYPTGLLEHMVSILGILDHLSEHYAPYLDRDLLFLGGVFHDIGKVWELQYERLVDYTTEGKLIGHLVMGVELIERKIQALDAEVGRLPGKFPEEKRLLAKHVVLAHHGELEYGSPKRPKCLEALVVHYIDDLDSKINAIRCFIEADQTPGQWTALSKMYGRYFFKPEWATKAE